MRRERRETLCQRPAPEELQLCIWIDIIDPVQTYTWAKFSKIQKLFMWCNECQNTYKQKNNLKQKFTKTGNSLIPSYARDHTRRKSLKLFFETEGDHWVKLSDTKKSVRATDVTLFPYFPSRINDYNHPLVQKNRWAQNTDVNQNVLSIMFTSFTWILDLPASASVVKRFESTSITDLYWQLANLQVFTYQNIKKCESLKYCFLLTTP